MDIRLKFGEHEGSVRIAQGLADSNSNFLSALLTFRVLHKVVSEGYLQAHSSHF